MKVVKPQVKEKEKEKPGERPVSPTLMLAVKAAIDKENSIVSRGLLFFHSSLLALLLMQ